ncbi:MAG: hypothetical protein HC929_24570 [Leptolyngbyaceae cyanobacterium SM2_5_2]|nr:hypothetical protein [Leptolyngbyaceae cyanobacterium SM2_5_2]
MRVSLNLPLRLERVTFASGVMGAVTVHRVDGAAISEQPTTGKTISNGQITLTDGFSDRQFILKHTDGSLNVGQITELWFTSYPTSPRLGLLDQEPSPAGLIPLWQGLGSWLRAEPRGM